LTPFGNVITSGVAASRALRALPVCFRPAASSASRVRTTPAKPLSSEWFDAVVQLS
jgi:hypothetical protein